MRLADQLHIWVIVTLAAQQRFPELFSARLRNVRNHTNIAIVSLLQIRDITWRVRTRCG
jgi:hypothetical protein